MGYFPNGSAGCDYQNRYCSKCKHDQDDNCPVYLAHMLYNYDQLGDGNEKLKEALNILIPESKDGLSNEKCTMFLAKSEQANERE